jgi:hypothetical protein
LPKVRFSEPLQTAPRLARASDTSAQTGQGTDVDNNLAVSFQRTYMNQPLAIVHNLPGGDAELQPSQLRALAAALLAAAQDCEVHHAEQGRKGIPGTREYPLGPRAQA